jgi:DNA helicase-2/ATP-dependent DNA helicase PcrA
MTRAKDHLHLVVPQRFFAHQQRGGGDRHMYASCTRFIPAAIRQHFESRAWPLAGATDSRAAMPREPVDIGARLRRMWR